MVDGYLNIAEYAKGVDRHIPHSTGNLGWLEIQTSALFEQLKIPLDGSMTRRDANVQLLRHTRSQEGQVMPPWLRSLRDYIQKADEAAYDQVYDGDPNSSVETAITSHTPRNAIRKHQETIKVPRSSITGFRETDH